MKRTFGTILMLLMAITLVLSGCGASNKEQGAGDKEGKLSIGYYVNGNLGDSGFFDSAQAGLDRVKSELGMTVKTVQGGTNQSDWPVGLESMVSSAKYDAVVVGTSQMKDIAIDLAKRYPKQKFIYFDETIVDVPNIYSVKYDQREGSFLAGAFAALVTTNTELTATNPEKVIGFVGGMDIPIINDFKAGYEQGAKYVDPEVSVISSFVGDFINAPKGKELGLAQYNSQNADIVFNVAGPAGIGVIEAGKTAGKYSIGVNSNQNHIAPGSVLTSMLKNVDNSIFRAVELMSKNELPFGKNEALGFVEGGVGLATDDLYTKHVPQSIQDEIEKIREALVAGEIKVE